MKPASVVRLRCRRCTGCAPHSASRPLDWQAPDGYADVATRWRSSSALLQVWDYHLAFLGQWASGFVPGDIPALYGGTPQTIG